MTNQTSLLITEIPHSDAGNLVCILVLIDLNLAHYVKFLYEISLAKASDTLELFRLKMLRQGASLRFRVLPAHVS